MTVAIPKTKKFKGKNELAKKKNELWNLLREYLFNKYDNRCYACGASNLEGSNRHLGHYIPGSICPTDLYFDLNNLRPECYRCNVHLSGNAVHYRANLIQEIGVQAVEDIETRARQGKPIKWLTSDYDKRIEYVLELIRNS